jgi:hypothetical protein
MAELKRLRPEAIPAAIEKAEYYRLLNEPRAAESICLDILDIQPGNQPAAVLLLLSRTDQFTRESGGRIADAQRALARIEGEYEGEYFAGIVCERWAKALLTRNSPGCGPVAYEWFTRAIEFYEKAGTLRAADNDDPILRYNACVRLMQRHDNVRPDDDTAHPAWSEEA